MFLRRNVFIDMSSSPDNCGSVRHLDRAGRQSERAWCRDLPGCARKYCRGVGIALNFVAVFDDAAGSNVRKRESFLENFRLARFHNELVEDLSAEIDYLAIGMNRARANIFNFKLTLYVGDFDVRVLLAFFGENFDAVIIVSVESVLFTISSRKSTIAREPGLAGLSFMASSSGTMGGQSAAETGGRGAERGCRGKQQHKNGKLIPSFHGQLRSRKSNYFRSLQATAAAGHRYVRRFILARIDVSRASARDLWRAR